MDCMFTPQKRKHFKQISHGVAVGAGGWEAGGGCVTVGGVVFVTVGGEVLAGWAYTFKWLN